MKTARPALFALALLIAPSIAGAAIEFIGTYTVNGTTKFYLADPDAGTRSGWIEQGQTFAGFTLHGYNATTSRLELTRNGASTVLWPKDPKIMPTGLIQAGTLTTVVDGKRSTGPVFLTLNRENFFVLPNGVVVHVTPREQLGGLIRVESFYELPSATGLMRRHDSPAIVFASDKSATLNIAENPRDPAAGFTFQLRLE